MAAIGRGLMALPKLLMFDEPSLGLAPILVEDVFNIVKKINGEGVTVLLVEQNVAAALKIADYGYVMEHGRIVYEDTAPRLLGHADIQEFYLGVGQEGRAKSYRDVKQYRRKRRWHG